jgi:hypothetical protein
VTQVGRNAELRVVVAVGAGEDYDTESH